jgi:hypothetical protein
MADIALDLDKSSPNYGDWLLDSTGDLVMTSDIDSAGTDPVLQNVHMGLNSFQGEWFLNLTSGFPWLQRVLGKGRSQSDVYGVFQSYILGIAGITQLNQLNVTLDPATRGAMVGIQAQGSTGTINYDGRIEYAGGTT